MLDSRPAAPPETPARGSAMIEINQRPAAGPTIRLHIGLEDPVDLIADLEQALQHLR